MYRLFIVKFILTMTTDRHRSFLYIKFGIYSVILYMKLFYQRQSLWCHKMIYTQTYSFHQKTTTKQNNKVSWWIRIQYWDPIPKTSFGQTVKVKFNRLMFLLHNWQNLRSWFYRSGPTFDSLFSSDPSLRGVTHSPLDP